MGYNAIGLHPNDLLGGVDMLTNLESIGLPVVSANIADSAGDLIFSPYIINTFGEYNIGVIGITGSQTTVANVTKNPPGIKILNWQESLKRYVDELATKSDFILLLSSLSEQENSDVTAQFPEIKMIITASPTQGSVQPEILKDCLITQVSGRGKYLGKIDITYNIGSAWQSSAKKITATQLQNKLNSVDWQIASMTKKQDASASGLTKQDQKKLARLQAYRKTLAAQFTEVSSAINEEKRILASSRPNTFQSSFLPVYPVGSGTKVDKTIQQLRSQIRNANTQKNHSVNSAAELDNLLLKNFIVGNDRCISCHEKQATFWRATNHARAYASLQKRDQNSNPDCLPCHVNGGSITASSKYAHRNLLQSLGEERRGVSCENCHGPGWRHASSPETVQPLMRKPTQEVCVVCHTQERDNNFDYQRKLPLIACPAS